MWPILKTKMIIFQSKANLCMKILFCKITHHLDPEVSKMLVRGRLGTRIPHSHSGP